VPLGYRPANDLLNISDLALQLQTAEVLKLLDKSLGHGQSPLHHKQNGDNDAQCE